MKKVAVKQFVPKKKEKKVKKHSVVLFLLAAVFVGLVVTGCIVNYAHAAQNNAQAAALSKECKEIMTQNDELEHFLEDKNHDEYYEKIAREQYGYAKPGERIFYDSSFGK